MFPLKKGSCNLVKEVTDNRWWQKIITFYFGTIHTSLPFQNTRLLVIKLWFIFSYFFTVLCRRSVPLRWGHLCQETRCLLGATSHSESLWASGAAAAMELCWGAAIRYRPTATPRCYVRLTGEKQKSTLTRRPAWSPIDCRATPPSTISSCPWLTALRWWKVVITPWGQTQSATMEGGTTCLPSGALLGKRSLLFP